MNKDYNYWSIRYRVSNGLILRSMESNTRIEVNTEIANIRANKHMTELEAINTLIYNISNNIGYEDEYTKVTYNCTAAELEELQNIVHQDLIQIFQE